MGVRGRGKGRLWRTMWRSHCSILGTDCSILGPPVEDDVGVTRAWGLTQRARPCLVCLRECARVPLIPWLRLQEQFGRFCVTDLEES